MLTCNENCSKTAAAFTRYFLKPSKNLQHAQKSPDSLVEPEGAIEESELIFTGYLSDLSENDELEESKDDFLPLKCKHATLNIPTHVAHEQACKEHCANLQKGLVAIEKLIKFK
jgi:hypothetical protein